MNQPKYDEIVILGIKNKKIINWYIIDKYLCLLDLTKLNPKSLELYMKGNNYIRKDILTINNNNIDLFLERIRNNKVTCEELQLMLLKDLNNIEQFDIYNYYPVLYYNFDEKELYSQYPEPFNVEEFLTTEWKFFFDDFSNLIDVNERYWLYNNKNIFRRAEELKKQHEENKYQIKFNKQSEKKENTNNTKYKKSV